MKNHQRQTRKHKKKPNRNFGKISPPVFVEGVELPALTYLGWRKMFTQFKTNSGMDNWEAVNFLSKGNILPSRYKAMIQTTTSLREIFRLLDGSFPDKGSELQTIKDHIQGDTMADFTYSLRARLERIREILHYLNLFIEHFEPADELAYGRLNVL